MFLSFFLGMFWIIGELKYFLFYLFFFFFLKELDGARGIQESWIGIWG